MAQLLDSSGAPAAVGRSLGRWLCGGDFVTTEPEAPEETPEPAWRGPLGFPRDWPAVYTSSPRLKALISKRGRIPGRRVCVAGHPTREEREAAGVHGLRFHPLQSFSNAERAAANSGALSMVEGWAIFERLDRPPGEVFVAERYWWNALPDGRWVDLTPRPEACPTLLLAEAADGAPKARTLLTAEEAAMAARLLAQRFPAALAAARARAPAPAARRAQEKPLAAVGPAADRDASLVDYSKWSKVVDSDDEEDGSVGPPTPAAGGVAAVDVGVKDLADAWPAQGSPPPLPQYLVGIGAGGGGTACLLPLVKLLDAGAQENDHLLAHTFSRIFRCGIQDAPRQCFYRDALAAAPPGAFVVVLGLGSVLPALAAARRGGGALLLERSTRLAALAKELARANGLTMPVAPLPAGLDSESAVAAALKRYAPEGVGEVVILTERFGHDLLSNGIVPACVAAHAAVRSALPGARIQHVPQTIELVAAPVEIRSEELGPFDIRSFNALRSTSSNAKADFWWWPVRLDNQPNTRVKLHGPAEPLCGFDFHRSPEITLDEVRRPLKLRITSRGRCNGVALWWRATSGGLGYSTEPQLAKGQATQGGATQARSEWKQAVHYLAGETDVFVGDTLEVLVSIAPRFTVRMMQQSPFSVESPAWVQAPTHPEFAATLPILPYHFLMLTDTERLNVYGAAIRDAVTKQRARLGRRPRVLDIGCGLGLLGVTAALEGADAWLREAVPMMRQMCREVLAVNAPMIQRSKGLVQLLPPMMSTDLKVGEHTGQKFDIIVSEVMDIWGLGEGVIPTMKHAHDRLLADGGVMLPSRLAVMVQPLELSPWGPLEREHKTTLVPLANAFKGKFSPMRIEHFPRRWLADEPTRALDIDLAAVPPERGGDQPNLEGTTLCMRMDKKPALAARIATMSIDHSGMLHGYSVWWAADLGNDHVVSTAPSSRQRSWKQLVRWVDEPRHVGECEEVQVLACYNERSVNVEDLFAAPGAAGAPQPLLLAAAARRGDPAPPPGAAAPSSPAAVPPATAPAAAEEEPLRVD
ncbi:unnamed protein product [Prorocentrum cordatum]|uniref:Protein arginine N-methyltransferase n=1 Tax=Prorocentrum cordatum TaxID=2364126 RepID=A0ABN9U485_9DINO|nr:unnamed protein product [Polarella glacialis]